MSWRRVLLVWAVISGLLCSARPAWADTPAASGEEAKAVPTPTVEGPRLHWEPGWKRFGTGHIMLTGTSLVLAVSKYLIGPRDTKVYGGWWVDESVRDGLRLDSAAGRHTARVISNVGAGLSIAYPVFDAIVVAGFVHDSPDVAVQTGLITAEVLAVSMALQSIFNMAVSRERPYGRTCGTELSADSAECERDNRYFSFYSGHSSQSFAMAAVSCTHHIRFPLYGGGAPDVAACLGAFAVAATTATLRISADKHYLTDVLAGAGMGTLVGFGLPWLLHYRHGASDGASASARNSLGLSRFLLLPTPTGVVVQGEY